MDHQRIFNLVAAHLFIQGQDVKLPDAVFEFRSLFDTTTKYEDLSE